MAGVAMLQARHQHLSLPIPELIMLLFSNDDRHAAVPSTVSVRHAV